MRKSLGIVFAVALAVVPVSLSAQQRGGGPGGGGGRGMMRGNVASLVLEHKADLKLTDDQVKKLQALVAEAKVVQEKNSPLIEEMRALGKRPQELTDAEREHFRPAMEAMRDLTMQLMNILTPEQVQQLSAMNPGGPRRSAAPGPQR